MISDSELETWLPRLESVVEADVVVVGGGSAGFTAAYAAAQSGANTVVIENASSLGGSTTGGLVTSMMGWRVMRYPDQAEQFAQVSREQITGGFPAEFMYRLRAARGAWSPPGGQITTMVATDPEIVKSVMEQMLDEVGADIWYLAQFIEAVIEEGRVSGVIVACEGALHLVRCKAAVDASGDGDLAVRAGADFQFGRPSDGLTQPVTVAYTLVGVDFERFVEYVKQNPDEVTRWEKRTDFTFTLTAEMIEEYYRKGWPILVQGLRKATSQAVANGDYPIPLGADKPYPHLAFFPVFSNGEVVWSITNHIGDTGFGVDSTDRTQMKAALTMGRKYALSMANFYRKYVPGFEQVHLVQTAPILGVRESRRIVGDYMLTENDVRECRDFDDAVGRSGCRIDIHVPDSDSSGAASDIGSRGWYQIPYGVLLPRGVEGMLVAGRCVSSDHVAHGSMRHQAVCMVTGHAAGTAAAMAAQQGLTPRQVEIEGIQAALRNQAAII